MTHTTRPSPLYVKTRDGRMIRETVYDQPGSVDHARLLAEMFDDIHAAQTRFTERLAVLHAMEAAA